MARKKKGGGRKPPSPPNSVGYRHPPKHAQFKPGQSGNPAGRPKGRRNFLTDVNEELIELVKMTVNGQPKEISMQRVLIKSAFGKAANGDTRMLALIFGKMLDIDANSDLATEVDIDPGDQKIIDRHIARLIEQQRNDGGSDE